MPTTTMTVKGQVTIPQEFRRLLQLEPGAEIEFLMEDGKLILRRKAPGPAALRAWAKRSRGKANAGLTTDEVMRLTRGDE